MKSNPISLSRMRNSLLTDPSSDPPASVVAWHGAMQAQDYGPTKWSLALRGDGIGDPEVESAMEEGEILRTHALRPTWHVIARDDIRWMLELTGPRVQKKNGPRYRELGLDGASLVRCERVIASALEGDRNLTRPEIATELEHHRIDVEGQRLSYILMHCELELLICSGRPAGKQQTYALLDERCPEGSRLERDEGLLELTRRYLQSHGPAAIQDLSWWSGLTVTDIKTAIEKLGQEVIRKETDGMAVWSLASETKARPAARAAVLLPTYDEMIVGYSGSRFLGDPRRAEARSAWKDRSLPNAVLLIRGSVAGLWRRRVSGKTVAVELRTFSELRTGELRAVQVAAADLGAFLQREVKLDIATI